MAKVLIVDDSNFMRKLLIGIISKKFKGIEILEASDGVEAVQKFKTESPDLVLLDIIMENKDGIEALREIKGLNKNAKVIMVSAVGQEQMVKESLDLGANNFVVKPFSASKVEEVVNKVLKTQ